MNKIHLFGALSILALLFFWYHLSIGTKIVKISNTLISTDSVDVLSDGVYMRWIGTQYAAQTNAPPLVIIRYDLVNQTHEQVLIDSRDDAFKFIEHGEELSICKERVATSPSFPIMIGPYSSSTHVTRPRCLTHKSIEEIRDLLKNSSIRYILNQSQLDGLTRSNVSTDALHIPQTIRSFRSQHEIEVIRR
jgi:hypothetical protein